MMKIKNASIPQVSLAMALVFMNLSAPVLTVTAQSIEATNFYANSFIPIDGKEIVYYEERRIRHETIPECLPSPQDSAGNWGEITDGLQLSVRLRKSEHLPDEPIQLLVILRNVTTAERMFWFGKQGPAQGFDYTLRQGTNLFHWVKEEKKTGLDRVRPMHESMFIAPLTQQTIVVQLKDFFDLGKIGEYEVSAKHAALLRTYHGNKTNIVSGGAKFCIVEKLSPTEIEARRAFAEKLEAHRERFAPGYTPPTAITNAIPQRTKDN